MDIPSYFEDQEVAAFIEAHQEVPIPTLALKLHGKPHLPKEYILNQINALQKLKSKLPDWIGVKGLVFPSKVSFEQCSSSETAMYKASIVHGVQHMVDLTGGFGVDAYYFAKVCSKLVYVERQEDLVRCVGHNMNMLGVKHVELHGGDAIDWLNAHAHKTFDLVYLDPARRGTNNEKLYKIEDCEPNILALLPDIYKISNRALVKFSPMIDLTDLYRQLPDIKELHVVSVKNECKEVVVYLEKGWVDEVKVFAVDLGRAEQQIFMYVRDESVEAVTFSEPLQYVYEPNASLMKAQCFSAIGARYGIAKLAPHTHLYTSQDLIRDFPGRTFKIIDTCEYSEKALQKKFSLDKANITARNFGESVTEVRKKLKLKDGGHTYIYATSTVSRKKLLLVCQPVQ